MKRIIIPKEKMPHYIKYCNSKKESSHLLGKDDVLGFMRTRKRILEKEFEEL